MTFVGVDGGVRVIVSARLSTLYANGEEIGERET